MKCLKVTLIRSVCKRSIKHKACVRGLGLRRVRQTVEVKDTLAVRGMIDKVAYLLKVESI